MLLGRPVDHVTAPGRQPGAQTRDVGQGLRELLMDHLGGRRVGERVPADQGLEGQHAQPVHVGRRARLPTTELFGGEVVGEGARAHLSHDLGREVASDAEVGEVAIAFVVEEHVLGLHVAVDHPVSMGRVQRQGQLVHEPDGVVGGHRPRSTRRSRRLPPRRNRITRKAPSGPRQKS